MHAGIARIAVLHDRRAKTFLDVQNVNVILKDTNWVKYGQSGWVNFISCL